MADKPWKVFERKIAAVFGTTRALMLGTNEVKDIGPEDDFPLVLDCKLWKVQNWQIATWFAKLQDNCKRKTAKVGTVVLRSPERWPVLCLREPGKQRKYAIVDRVQFFSFVAELSMMKMPMVELDGKMCYQGLVANDIYHWKADKFGPLALTRTWADMMKEMGRHNMEHAERLSEYAIPMMSMKQSSSGMNLTVLKPEDLARLFRLGGVLSNESQN